MVPALSDPPEGREQEAQAVATSSERLRPEPSDMFGPISGCKRPRQIHQR